MLILCRAGSTPPLARTHTHTSRRAPFYEPAPAPAGCSALFFFHTSMRSRSCTVHIVKSSLSSARSTSFVGGASIVKQFGRMPTTPPVSVSTATMSASGIIIDGFVMILLQVGFGFTISILTITVDVEVTTEWAVTGGMLASTWSALQSHLLLLAHHRAAGPAAEPTKPRRAVPPKRSLAVIVLVFACSMGAVGVGAYGATQQNTTSYTYGGFAVRIPPLPAGPFLRRPGPFL